MKILVVDDDRAIRQIMTECFERAGHRVLTARDGVEALEIADFLNPDLVLTDCDMPKKSGLQLATELHKLQPGLPVVMLSGREIFSHRERVLIERHVQRVLTKPVPLSELVQVAERLQRVAA